MIQHLVSEGWQLIRQRGLMTAMLTVTLAVPLCLAGLTFTAGAWLRPLADLGQERLAIPVLLHPVMEHGQREEWLARQKEDNADWEVREIPPEMLSQRLSHWFPYLTDLLKNDPNLLLPQLIEIETAQPSTLDRLARSPAVIAVGPRTSVHRTIAAVASRLKWLALGVTITLLGSVVLLTAVWIHLELYRHADEITIMRLIGATEGVIQGPFLVAAAIPGIAAGLLAAVGTAVLSAAVSRLTAAAGLPPLETSAVTVGLQLLIGAGLPLATGVFTLRRHASEQLEE